MRSYAIRGFMDWLSNMAFIQYFSSNRSFFISFAQYFLVLTAVDICRIPKPARMSVPSLREEFPLFGKTLNTRRCRTKLIRSQRL